MADSAAVARRSVGFKLTVSEVIDGKKRWPDQTWDCKSFKAFKAQGELAQFHQGAEHYLPVASTYKDQYQQLPGCGLFC